MFVLFRQGGLVPEDSKTVFVLCRRGSLYPRKIGLRLLLHLVSRTVISCYFAKLRSLNYDQNAQNRTRVNMGDTIALTITGLQILYILHVSLHDNWM